MSQSVAEDFRSFIAQRLRSAHAELSARWLERLSALLPVEADAVFPGPDLLDHIPALIVEIADYLETPSTEAIGAKTAVVAKARELGVLRFEQRASVHQILREYRILDGVLHAFIRGEVAALTPTAVDLVDVLAHVHQSVSVLQDHTLETFVGAYGDATAKRTSQLEAFNRVLSHELRQPVGTLEFAVRLLPGKTSGADGEQARLVALIERNVRRLADLSRHLPRLAAMQDSDAMHVQRVQIGTVVREVARQLREMADARGVAIEVADDLGDALVDLGVFELMLVNLISNAVKYSDPGKARRWVRVGAVPAAGWALRVADNGIGIPSGHLPRIFDSTFRAHAARDGELGTEGLGMGLTIVRDCLRILGGEIDVESVEGEGTTFVVRLAGR